MKRGFTVIELIVVIGVIALLVALVALGYRSAQDDSHDTARRAAVQQIMQAVDTLKMHTDDTIMVGGYMASSPTTKGPDANGRCVYNPTAANTSTTGSNWVYYEGTSSYYPCTLGKMLILTGLLPTDFFSRIPEHEGYTKTAAMVRTTAMTLYSCDTPAASSKRWILYYYLKNPTPEEAASIDTLWDACTATSPTKTTLKNTLKMSAAVEIKL